MVRNSNFIVACRGGAATLVVAAVIGAASLAACGVKGPLKPASVPASGADSTEAPVPTPPTERKP